jgi:hypothetical protein
MGKIIIVAFNQNTRRRLLPRETHIQASYYENSFYPHRAWSDYIAASIYWPYHRLKLKHRVVILEPQVIK